MNVVCILIFLYNLSFMFINADVKVIKPLELFKSLDLNTLSRLLAFHNRFNGVSPTNARHALVNGWAYKENVVWPQRLSVYGYDIAVQGARGDGNCLFNSLYQIFRDANYDKFRMLSLVDESKLPKAVYIALRNILSTQGNIGPMDFKKISIIAFVGMDPDIPESKKEFNPNGVIERLKNILGTGVYDTEESRKQYRDGIKIIEGLNPWEYYEPLIKGGNVVDAAEVFYRKLEELNKKDGVIIMISCYSKKSSISKSFYSTIQKIESHAES